MKTRLIQIYVHSITAAKKAQTINVKNIMDEKWVQKQNATKKNVRCGDVDGGGDYPMIRSASFLKIQKTQQSEFGQNERFINNRFVRNGKKRSKINPANGFANESKRKCETKQKQKATATISVVSH